MVIDQESLEFAVTKLMATVRTAIYPNGDTLGGWKFLTETAGLTVQPAAARATETRAGDARHAAVQAPGGQPGRPAPGAGPAGGAVTDGRAADGRAQVPQHS